MKVALVNPPSPYLSDDRAQAPMGLLYLAANLEKYDHQVSIVDLAGDPRWKDSMLKVSADVVGASCTTPNVPIVKDIFALSPRNCLKIAGGAHPTSLPKESLFELGCHAVVKGEGEVILPKIITEYELTGHLRQQIYDGGLVDLDKIPLPARHLLDLRAFNPEMEGNRAACVWSSRGCHRRCGFCTKLTGNKVRFRKVSLFIDEIKLLVDRYGFKNFIIMDDNFCLNQRRAKLVCQQIVKEEIDINIRAVLRADSATPSLMKWLSKAGVTEISYGVETGSQRMLNMMQKDTTVEVQKNAIKITKAEGILAKIYLIVNFPEETDDTVSETKDFVLDTEPDKYLLQQFIPYPNCDVWLHPKKYGVTWISSDYSQFFTVGKGGQGGYVFETHEATIEMMRARHDDLYDFLTAYKPNLRA